MTNIVTAKARTLLVRSLHPVEARRDAIQAELRRSLARSEQDPELSDTPGLVATLLLNFLTDQVRHVVHSGEPRDLDLHRDEQRLNGIAGRHYSRFGDALAPVIRDALGPTFPRETGSAWSDVFWALVRRMQQRDEPGDDPAPAMLIAELVD